MVAPNKVSTGPTLPVSITVWLPEDAIYFVDAAEWRIHLEQRFIDSRVEVLGSPTQYPCHGWVAKRIIRPALYDYEVWAFIYPVKP